MIDKFSTVPAYLQIEAIIAEQIAKELLKPGDLIPSEPELSDRYEVSRMTARKAVDYLARQGLVERRRGLGTFVRCQKREVKFELPLDRHLTASEMSSGSDVNIVNKVLKLEIHSCDPETARILAIEPGSDIWYMERVKRMNGTPFVYEQTKMRFSGFENLSIDILNDSKYAYLRSINFHVGGSKKILCAELPPRYVRDQLGIPREEPVLHSLSHAFFEDGVVFEVSHIYYNQQHFNFTINAKR
ncbi:GntR family transcriptional regulator [Sansalvadorimonas verongulae]|uniref:GntR family transcriptional regulator n=1 Tax=Sansalvadorimonas verongulae TaxID=2172824 RepID=UPI0012BC602D|nr:GntR family transcriptional regulator [Sansalvadorimonas verongulae]MTI12531.1 GntR family transcriptional regulator [Sansalvadorimonas verongulae]